MEIGGIKAVSGVPQVNAAEALPADSISKNIQDKISELQQQKKALSSDENITADDKMKKRKEIQQEISSLNAKLRQRQSEIRREQRREELAGDMKKDSEVKDTDKKDAENKDAGNSSIEDADSEESSVAEIEMQAVAIVDSAMEQTRYQKSVITGMEDGIVILKGEIRQDKTRGVDVEKKEKELEKQEEKVKKASEYQFAALGNAYRTMREAIASGTEDSNKKTVTDAKDDSNSNAIIRATNFLKEKEAVTVNII